MNGRVRSVSGYESVELSAGWRLAACAPGAADAPGREVDAMEWVPAVVPGTAAASLRALGTWSLDAPPRRFDAEDWWFRTTFAADPASDGEELWLHFDGLATVADVWLNGQRLFRSENMFVGTAHRVDGLLTPENELLIRCSSLDALLRERRPRPRWRVPMLEEQQLRWFRTTLLGRTPGWSPPAAPVGPWRPVRLERRRMVAVDDVRLSADADGELKVSGRVTGLGGRVVTSVEIALQRQGKEYVERLEVSESDGTVSGRLTVPEVDLWWPHTHGEPALYAARLRVDVSGESVEVDLGAVGFRSVAVDTEAGDFRLRVNGVPVFCRGACWTPLDPVALSAAPEALSRTFDQVVESGMNMLRVGGTMVYEEDAFLDLCDARGVLLWHEFMFANMDYPEDPRFVENVRGEARSQLARIQGRPSLAVLCGNSEGEQQAAMWGAPRDRWSPPLFHLVLADMAREACPEVLYWPSSGHGGAFPHQGNSGTTSYFGVGAYRRSLDDARRSEVRFASECLAFANVPDPEAMADVPGGHRAKVHLPGWKARSPRDLGAGWDFDDVRDEYLRRLFSMDPVSTRYADHERYLSLGRVVTGEVMGAVFGEWRRARSVTRGGLVWFLRDLWPGAGWGVIDSAGRPKAPWHYLRRALAPVALFLTDEGCNGVGVHVVNDPGTQLDGELELTLFRGDVRVERGTLPVSVPPHGAVEWNAGAFFDFFMDLSYAHRFGPPSHDLIVATLRTEEKIRAQTFHFPLGLPTRRSAGVGLEGEARARPDGAWDLLVRSGGFAQSVHVDVSGFTPSDSYFHVAPRGERQLLLRPNGGDSSAPPRGTLHALNAEAPASISVAG